MATRESQSKYERIWELRGLAPRGKLMILGGPSLNWENAPAPEDFYKSFGFDEVHTMDVSDYQRASHIHDLNCPLPRELEGQYDVVMSGGTLEHVFDVANALKSLAAMVKTGGEVFCDLPTNNFIDHGFYQLSPTLMFDFFNVNRFEFLSSRGALVDPKSETRRAFPLYPGEGHRWNATSRKLKHFLRARRVPESTVDRIPLQGRYLDRHEGKRRKFRFEASAPEEESTDGITTSPPMTRFTLSGFRPLDGRWLAPFRHAAHLGSLDQLPFRSRGLVYEEGALLKWVVSDPDMVKERPGSFYHDPRAVHFTTSDGSDPRSNGRQYEIAFPDLTDWLRG
jgi:SAM-dependent methyltransferase